MLQLAVYWFAQFVILAGWGDIFVGNVLVRWWRVSAWDRDLFVRFWIGTALLFVFLTLWYLVFPIGSVCLGIVIAIGIAGCVSYALRLRKTTALAEDATRVPGHRARRVLALALLVLIAASVAWRIAAVSVRHLDDDTEMYHYNIVRWANEYPAVPGLASLHGRFGMNSGWLRYAALWNNGFLQGRAAWITPCFFELVALAEWLGVLVLARRSSPLPARAFAMLTLPFFATVLGNAFPSLYYDAFSQTAILVLILSALRNWAAADDASMMAPQPRFFLLLCLAGIAFAGKPIGATTLLCASLACVIVLFRQRQTAGTFWVLDALRCLMVPALLAAGFIALNAITTGWLLFPLPVGRLPADWALPEPELNDVLVAIKGWARLPGPEYRDSLTRGFWYWFLRWKTIFNRSLEKEVLLFCVFLLPAWLYSGAGRPWNTRRWLECALLALAAANLVFWFQSAPDLRFGSSFFFAALALIAAFWLESLIVAPKLVLGICLLLTAHLANELRIDWLPAHGSHGWDLGKSRPGATRPFTVPNGQDPPLIVLLPIQSDTLSLGDCPLPSTPYEPTARLLWREPGNLRKGFCLLPESPKLLKP